MRFVTLLFLAVSLSACVTGGERFDSPGVAPPGSGAIYFFRPKAFVGAAVDVMLVDGEQDIERIGISQFIRYEASPGRHTFRTDTMLVDKALELDIEPGKTYYVRVALKRGVGFSTWWMTRVYDEEALPELRECCLDGADTSGQDRLPLMPVHPEYSAQRAYRGAGAAPRYAGLRPATRGERWGGGVSPVRDSLRRAAGLGDPETPR